MTHEFTFDQIEDAYEVFGNNSKHNALKMFIHNGARMLKG